jgi:hypothetical protein
VCHALTLEILIILYVWLGEGEILCFLFLCSWPGMVPNQRQLSIVVSDWGSYLGSPFPTIRLWDLVFCLVSAPDRTVHFCFFLSLLFCFGVINKKTMYAYHAAPRSTLHPPTSAVTVCVCVNYVS